MIVYLYKVYKGDLMKTVIISIGLLIILVYISPLYKSKVNLGNIFGITFGGFIIICALLLEQIKTIFKYPIGKTLIIFFTALFIVFFIFFFTTLFKIIYAIKNNAEKETTIIILGCRVKGKAPSKALAKRCQVAAEYMKSNEKSIAMLSGGQGSDEELSEAECMYNLMKEYGINTDRLIKEENSTSTYENMAFSKKIIDKQGLSKNISVATSEYHIFRAKEYANMFGLKASSLSAKSIPILRVPYFTREIFAIWVLKVKKCFAQIKAKH